MSSNRIKGLQDIREGGRYYLFHRDANKPQPFVNIYVEVVYKGEHDIVVNKTSGEYFIDDTKTSHYSVIFKKHFYMKSWYLQ